LQLDSAVEKITDKLNYCINFCWQLWSCGRGKAFHCNGLPWVTL